MEDLTQRNTETLESQTRSTKGSEEKAVVSPVNDASVAKERSNMPAESGHWYLMDGTPFYTVLKAKGDGERPVTIRDARKVGAVPSVTTVTKIIGSEALSRYFARQMFDATQRVSRFHGETDDIYFARCTEASKEHAGKAAERGTALHGAIEQFLRGELLTDKSWLPHIAKLVLTLAQYGIDIRAGAPEKSFAHKLGFGGKVDLHMTGEPIVLDFKSKPTLDPAKRYGYDNHCMQLAAYREGLGIPGARCINVFIGCDDRKIILHEWSQADAGRGWEMFTHTLALWKLLKGYSPELEQSAKQAA